MQEEHVAGVSGGYDDTGEDSDIIKRTKQLICYLAYPPSHPSVFDFCKLPLKTTEEDREEAVSLIRSGRYLIERRTKKDSTPDWLWTLVRKHQ